VVGVEFTAAGEAEEEKRDGLLLAGFPSLPVIVQGRLERLFCKYRAMLLGRRETAECLGDRFVGDQEGLMNRLADDQLGRHAARCYGSAATEGLEACLHDTIILYLQV